MLSLSFIHSPNTSDRVKTSTPHSSSSDTQGILVLGDVCSLMCYYDREYLLEVKFTTASTSTIFPSRHGTSTIFLSRHMHSYAQLLLNVKELGTSPSMSIRSQAHNEMTTIVRVRH